MLLGPTAIPPVLPPQPSAAGSSPNPIPGHPVLWRAPFPKDDIDSLVSWTNLQGTVNTSKLELVGGIIHSGCVA